MSEPLRGSVSLRPSELVIAAIHNMRERKGSSPNDIISFISKKYELDTEQVKNHVEKALKRGVCFGVLSESEGLYRLLNVNMSKIAAAAAGEPLRKKRVVQRARKGGKGGKVPRRARRGARGTRRKSRVSEFQQRCHMLRGKGRKREKRNTRKKTQRRRPRNPMSV